MSTPVVSLRLPSATMAALARSATASRISVAKALDWLLRNSIGNSGLLSGLSDCPERLDAKLDARISGTTLDSLRVATARLEISKSVYIRRLLHHFYVTKRLKYMKSNEHYTLAYRHD